MIRKYPNLCKPITIGPKSTAFYELRAKGGAAAVTVSELMVHPATDASHAYHLNTETVGSVASFTYTADAIKRHGGGQDRTDFR